MARPPLLPMEPQNETEKRVHGLLDKVFGIHHVWEAWMRREQWGDGIAIKLKRSFSSYDFMDLTRLVLAAHEFAVRVEISPHTFRSLRLEMHPRQREGRLYERHPTIEQALASYGRLCPHGNLPIDCGRGCAPREEKS